jgi:pyruvate/2-oxoglutarate dehydrogenase complex dihydrolipoamide acyltransferase (E2) component
LIEARGIDPARFAGMGLVRERDVLDLVEGRGEGLPAGARSKGAEWTRAELKESKRVEARSLLEGASNALASCVSAEMEAGRPPLARILKESAGLLLEHPFLNAFYDEGGVNLYSSVNVGFVIDAGRGIKVPVIRDAARRDAADIEREMQDLMLDYEEGTLGPSRLSGGTFTLTDLSELGADVFFPLIKEAQSAILGIGTRHLNLAFDHRVTEGREAALFLRDLKGRLKA